VPLHVRLDGVSLLPVLWGSSAHPHSRRKARRRLGERVGLWHNDYEGPRASALWVHDFKVCAVLCY